MTVKAVAFVSKSGSGKTTLLEKVIPRGITDFIERNFLL
jgi:molybdopterin-guanine dinucleotide biosynthesis protein